MYTQASIHRSGRQAGRFLLAGFLLLLTAGLAACGGDSSSSSNQKQCDTSSGQNCGKVEVGMSDASGDFAAYTVDVVSLKLVSDDGSTVDVLPGDARVDLSQYASLTEFVSAQAVPPGTYTKGVMTVDYSNADIEVERNGGAEEAAVVNSSGNAAGQVDLTVNLSNNKPLDVTVDHTSYLNLEFDLNASNNVDMSTSPATVTVHPFVMASLHAESDHNFRVHGSLDSVDTADASFTLRLHPFLRQSGDFGSTEVAVNSQTTYEVDGTVYSGSDGLSAMSNLSAGASVAAWGSYDDSAHAYTAARIYAGSSVPGSSVDGVRGSVTSRTASQLTVRGATLIRSDGSVHFNDNVTVDVGSGTQVYEAGDASASVDLSSVSVGQRVTVLGDVSTTSTGSVTLDATSGTVRLLPTHVSGSINSVTTSGLVLDVQSIDGRSSSIFDFSGTGSTSTSDADPANYEVDLGAISSTDLSASDPIRVTGFVSAYGAAPPDFHADSVIDFIHSKSAIAVGWGSQGTTAPFSVLNESSLVVDLNNGDLGSMHYLQQGSVRTDLTSLSSSPTVSTGATGHGLFAIAQDGTVTTFGSFADFEAELASRLDGSVGVSGLFCYGSYNATGNIFTASVIAVRLN